MNDAVAISGLIKKVLGWGIPLLLVTVLVLNSFYTTDAGYKYLVQDTVSGTLEVKQEPGIFFKKPFVTTITRYNNVATISSGNRDTGDRRSSGEGGSTTVAFADTYEASVPTTVRLALSSKSDDLILMHREFRSYSALVDSLFKKAVKDVLVLTATTQTGEEFFQGGLNEFKVAVETQLNDGLFVTQRKQVEIDTTGIADISSENPDADKLEKQKRLVWKNIVLRDSDGQPIISKNPLEKYGVTVSYVSMGQPIPNPDLKILLTTKKALVAKRINAVQKQETVREEAKAAQLEKEIEKKQAIQVALKESELAVIAGKKEVAVERQAKNRAVVVQEKLKAVAVVQKLKELEIARANKGIQEAAAIAAKFEAMAIREKGIAEADVLKAMYAAKQSASTIVMAEIALQQARVVYPALKDIKIDMPDFYSAGGSGQAAPNSLEVLTTLSARDMLQNRAPVTGALNPKN